MDKPTTPAGPDTSKSSWPEDSGSAKDFDATGVFGTVKAPEAAHGPAAGFVATPNAWENRANETAKPQPAPHAHAEPVVHKVVFGGGAAESAPDILDRMRMESAKPAHSPEKAPAAESGGWGAPAAPAPMPSEQGSAGFTQLLRAMGSDSPAPAVAAKEAPAPVARPSTQDAGFTSLLRTLGSLETASTSAEDPMRAARSASQFIPEEPRKAPPASTPGGFTELLRTVPAEDSYSSGAAKSISSPTESQPGSFTQLFSTLGSSGASSSAPSPVAREAADSSHESGGSFTRMLSLEQQSAPVGPAFHEERRPATESLNYGLTPEAAGSAGSFGGSAGASRDPFSPPPLPTAPQQSATPAAGVGITRLIRMLDEPGTPRVEAAPVSPPRGPEAGVWTQTFATLDTPTQPSTPAAKAPEWTPQQAPLVAPTPAIARDAHFPGEPAVNPPAAAGSATGPSEFTRIIDASRMREMAMRGGQVPGAANPPLAPMPPASAPPAYPALPNYPVPAPPQMGGMQGLGGAPHPGGFPPPQPPPLPAYPMSYPPPPAPGGSAPNMPGMYAPPPPPPMPAVPQAPPPKPVQPGVGKLQQMVPLLLIVVGFLFIVVLVLLIFLLLKH